MFQLDVNSFNLDLNRIVCVCIQLLLFVAVVVVVVVVVVVAVIVVVAVVVVAVSDDLLVSYGFKFQIPHWGSERGSREQGTLALKQPGTGNIC